MATITILFILESGRYKIALLVLASEKLGQQNILLNLAIKSPPLNCCETHPSRVLGFGAKSLFEWIDDLEGGRYGFREEGV